MFTNGVVILISIFTFSVGFLCGYMFKTLGDKK